MITARGQSFAAGVITAIPTTRGDKEAAGLLYSNSMKTELRICRTSTGYTIRAALPPLSRGRTGDGHDIDLSTRTDLGGSDVQLAGPFREREQAERALVRLRTRAAAR